MHENFRRFSERISMAAGSPRAFFLALVFVLAWAVSGPMFGFSDTWQLVINTGTTIITFLMVFLIQNAQNRDTVAVQLKLDELIRTVRGARVGMINIDQLSDQELDHLRTQFRELGDENGGCDELQATVSIESDINVSVHQAPGTSNAPPADRPLATSHDSDEAVHHEAKDQSDIKDKV